MATLAVLLFQNYEFLLYFVTSTCLILFIDIFVDFFSGKLYGDADFVEERHRHRYEVMCGPGSCLWF